MTKPAKFLGVGIGAWFSGLMVAIVVTTGFSFPVRAGSCLPEFIEPISIPPSSAPDSSLKGGSIYIDASGSMSGFLVPNNDVAFINFIYSISGTLESMVPVVDYFKFGSEVKKIKSSDFLKARDPNFFHTKINQLSRVSDAVHEINKIPADHIGLVISDMFLSDGDNPNAVNAPLREELAKAIHNGRSIGLLGLRVPFDGFLTDLATTEENIPFRGHKERAIFLMMIGSRPAIETFYQQIKIRLVDGGARLTQFSIFSTDLAEGPVALLMPNIRSRIQASGQILWTKDLFDTKLNIPNYRVSRNGGVINIEVKAEDQAISAFVPHELKLDAGLYLNSGSAMRGACPLWSERDDVRSHVILDPGGECDADHKGGHCLQIQLEPSWLSELPRRIPLLLAIKLSATPVEQVDSWLAEWGYPPEREPALLQALRKPSAKPPSALPEYYPTLNIDRLGMTLHSLTIDQFRILPPRPLEIFLAFNED